MSTAHTHDERRRPAFELRHRLVLAREVAEIDQSGISTALGISRTTVSNYERGFTVPKRAIVLAWAMATGVDAEWLISGNNESPRPAGPDEGSKLPHLDSNQEPIGSQPAPVLSIVRDKAA